MSTSSLTYRCQRHNRPVKLTQEVGQGGEATVWRTDFKGYVAKIYENPHNERLQKLQAIVVSSSPAPAKVIPKAPSQPKVGKKISLPKIVVPPSKPIIQKLPRRKVLIGLGAGIVTTAGITIFAQLRSERLVFAAVTPFTEQLPNGVQLEMVGLPGGKFLMGSPKSDPDAFKDEFPQHEVTVSSFAIGKYPVTQAQWQAVMGNNSSYFDDDYQNPVEQVSWDNCQAFCQKLSELTGKIYRLPSEAEWEYACRAGTTTRYSFGDDAAQLGNYAWYDANSDEQTHPVGQKQPNRWGLYDMHGNVYEWCEDGWHDNYRGAPTNGSAWTNNHSQEDTCVLRGGSWYYLPRFCRSAYRYRNYRGFVNFNHGLRLAFASSRT